MDLGELPASDDDLPDHMEPAQVEGENPPQQQESDEAEGLETDAVVSIFFLTN